MAQDLHLSERRLYFGSDILPDNILYPLVASQDQILLFLCADEDRADLQADLAEKRFKTAQELGKRGEWSLALVSMRKAQYHASQALSARAGVPLSESEKLRWTGIIEERVAFMRTAKPKITAIGQQTLDEIIEDTEALKFLF